MAEASSALISRAAVLVSSSLLGLQVRRVRKDLKVFDSDAEALDWLMAD